MIHTPVLQKEVLKYLDPKPNENFIDCTIDGGGHALAILERTAPDGKLLGIDADPEAIRNLKLKVEFRDGGTKRKKMAEPSSHSRASAKGEEESLLSSHIRNLEKRIILACDNFINLKEIVKQNKFFKIDGILFDLGMSSWHLEESGKGFSFLRKEFLDMRYNPENPQTAEKIVNYWSKNDIEKILREYGEEQFAKIIANEIIKTRKARPIKTTFELVEIIRKAVHGWYRRQKIHFATRTFQALRIAVNDELNNLKKVLPQTIDILKPGGRLVIISFHSLEDRIAKSFFSAFAKGYDGQERKLEILTKKPVRPSTQELNYNPRSRSARLRVAIKI